mgnify:CR=1 FL=1
MKKVLLVLSDVVSECFSPQAGIGVALALKAHGADRIDITHDPRIERPDAHGIYARPISDFDKTARNFSRGVILPVIGASDVIDLSYALSRKSMPPDIDSLSHVGRLYLQTLSAETPQDISKRDGCGIGLVFYLAAHKASGQTFYNTLLYPDLTRASQRILSTFSETVGKHIPGFGTPIHLDALHAHINKIRLSGYTLAGHSACTRPLN